MDNPICIYHGGCADGFTAAWAVWVALGAMEFYPAVYGDAPPDVAGRDVIMVDFSYKRRVLEAMADSANSILILDHHKTAEADLAGFGVDMSKWSAPFGADRHWMNVHQDQCEGVQRSVYVLFDMNRSGAQIAWDFFHPNTERPRLVEYIADRDLWRFELQHSRAVSAWLYSQEFSMVTWDSCRFALHENLDQVVGQGNAILRQHDRNVASLIRTTAREMLIGGQRVPVANCPHFMASDVGHAMAKGKPFSATYFDRDGSRVFSLRSHADGADVSEIAASYGGGGHKHAAGFKMPLGWEGDE